MKNPSLERIRQMLGSTKHWPRLSQAARALTDAELAQAEQLERLGKRRQNTLMAIRAEKKRRAGRGYKMQKLLVEAVR